VVNKDNTCKIKINKISMFNNKDQEDKLIIKINHNNKEEEVILNKINKE
jgi:hypothetical protein